MCKTVIISTSPFDSMEVAVSEVNWRVKHLLKTEKVAIVSIEDNTIGKEEFLTMFSDLLCNNNIEGYFDIVNITWEQERIIQEIKNSTQLCGI